MMEKIGDFFTALTTDGRFILINSTNWDLKENHKVKVVVDDGDEEDIEIELIGLCTDICVVSNALLLKAVMPEVTISVDPACCAGVTPESHEAALKTMQMCQIMQK